MSSGGPYNYSYIFKYIIIGDMGVGKSCLLHQFTEKKCKSHFLRFWHFSNKALCFHLSHGWLPSYDWSRIWYKNYRSFGSKNQTPDLGYSWSREVSSCDQVLLPRGRGGPHGVWCHSKIHLQSLKQLVDRRTKSDQPKYGKPQENLNSNPYFPDQCTFSAGDILNR